MNTAPVPQDEATHAFEIPFFNADHVVERLEADGETVVYDVIANEKLLFSTVSAPLAHSFIAGYNARSQSNEKSKSKPEKDVRSQSGASASDAPSDTSEDKQEPENDVTPVEPKQINSGKRKRSAF